MSNPIKRVLELIEEGVDNIEGDKTIEELALIECNHMIKERDAIRNEARIIVDERNNAITLLDISIQRVDRLESERAVLETDINEGLQSIQELEVQVLQNELTIDETQKDLEKEQTLTKELRKHLNNSRNEILKMQQAFSRSESRQLDLQKRLSTIEHDTFGENYQQILIDNIEYDTRVIKDLNSRLDMLENNMSGDKADYARMLSEQIDDTERINKLIKHELFKREYDVRDLKKLIMEDSITHELKTNHPLAIECP
jgi:chromosome segregation ATPase